MKLGFFLFQHIRWRWFYFPAVLLLLNTVVFWMEQSGRGE